MRERKRKRLAMNFAVHCVLSKCYVRRITKCLRRRRRHSLRCRRFLRFASVSVGWSVGCLFFFMNMGYSDPHKSLYARSQIHTNVGPSINIIICIQCVEMWFHVCCVCEFFFISLLWMRKWKEWKRKREVWPQTLLSVMRPNSLYIFFFFFFNGICMNLSFFLFLAWHNYSIRTTL